MWCRVSLVSSLLFLALLTICFSLHTAVILWNGQHVAVILTYTFRWPSFFLHLPCPSLFSRAKEILGKSCFSSRMCPVYGLACESRREEESGRRRRRQKDNLSWGRKEPSVWCPLWCLKSVWSISPHYAALATVMWTHRVARLGVRCEWGLPVLGGGGGIASAAMKRSSYSLDAPW